MSQQLYAEANTEIAPVINQLMSGTVISQVIENESSIASNYQLVQDVIYAKREGFIDVMYLNEKVSRFRLLTSHQLFIRLQMFGVPFPLVD